MEAKINFGNFQILEKKVDPIFLHHFSSRKNEDLVKHI